MKRIHVAAAVIRGVDGQILLAKRPEDKHQGGLWEFPGGKVEAGETVQSALVRELDEELGIRPSAARPLIQVRHDYPDKQVLLDVWEVSAFTGEPHGAEGQPLAWVSPRQLGDYEFPAANRPIVAAARLPERYLITPEGLSGPELLRGIQAALKSGIRLLQLRAPAMFDAQYRDIAVDALGLCAGKAQLMLKGPLEWLGDFPAAGWHLTAQQLRELSAGGRPFPAQRWLAASCHSAQELELATQMGVDFITLSPVQATQTHPDAQPLGWTQVAELLQGFNQPAYLLGGVTPADVEQAWQVGAQGVAGIRAFWPE
ncbi:Mutator mutT protein (7,8-dihydro-8-oxoguanine-triphosphatase) / Thiamin-phosphate pyrophosphorylase-like protein [Pseudomonas sp. 9AZ]|uniref:Nudix family hydrolase n=1 Tax=Pseudomonas sp. 9AZ TaxID=2653168 RepID=UPI0012EF3BDD|nr:Nudix family hydrolase [Pseudomonas sp. 9AZ]VXC48583.1 Mutator mutT protein (7,8-dihydro-8-oxoguanine-triphosphatase) / Thiamin-phosphate pyrophosphorylase-like protein [Pseudomonas sp. 9AZ]